MSQTFKVACIQVNAQDDIAANVEAAATLVCAARAQGAQLVMMPENVALMDFGRANILGKAMTEQHHAALDAFKRVARDTRLWLHCGTLGVRLPAVSGNPDDDMVANRTYLIDPEGAVVATYDKIHMFDVDLGGGEVYRESATFQAGARAVVATTPWGKLGLSICYDVRFPHLYRAQAKAGADFLAVPAAFTRTTGRAHWHVLLRARAIETGCFVFAPAQCGTHPQGRETYGHALIVSPWGEVLADAGEEPGVIVAEIDRAQVAEARAKVPALSHDRAFDLLQV